MTETETTQEYSPLEKEASSASIDDRSKFRKVTDFYFKPKSFEKTGKLYETLGIKWFRKYCPNGGSKFSLTESFVSGRKKEDLELFVSETKILEGMHTFGGIPLFTAFTIMNLVNEDYMVAGIQTVLNLLVNACPIMSNRRNRNKVEKMIDTLEKREARKK